MMFATMNFLLFAGLLLCINENGVLSTTTTREPSIQAYGLPKRFLTGSNGFIERVHLGDKTESEESKHATSLPSGNRRKFEPTVSTKSYDDVGIIEIFHLDSSPNFGSRNVRSIDPQDEIQSEDDLEAQESKVFRPLFAYRKQMEAKQRRERSERERRNNLPSQHSNGKKATQFPHYCFQSR